MAAHDWFLFKLKITGSEIQMSEVRTNQVSVLKAAAAVHLH